MPVAIPAVECTDLFAGTPDGPRQILRVTCEGPGAPVRVTGPGRERRRRRTGEQ